MITQVTRTSSHVIGHHHLIEKDYMQDWSRPSSDPTTRPDIGATNRRQRFPYADSTHTTPYIRKRAE
ncbi:hypothetical protein MSG28_004730 [Choristoneura fumiferana]|uniref:Uncharacterized protein n=1 Tax=Choristoneura fumiferana TaxID=7141 RepID=A0ACC0K7S3_CHOFU|nr:hypothetical protein MSG28_004730 [Choristoneura fumiferana]